MHGASNLLCRLFNSIQLCCSFCDAVRGCTATECVINNRKISIGQGDKSHIESGFQWYPSGY